MFNQTFTLNNSEFTLAIRSSDSDLALRGTDEPLVRVQGDGDTEDFNPEWNAETSTLTVDIESDLVLYIPREMTVRVTGNASEVSIGNVTTRFLYVEGIGGDAAVESMSGDLEIGGVGGDFRVRALNGNLQMGAVGGDARIENISGNLTLRGAGGDLVVQKVQGNAMVSGVGGDARLVDIGGATSSITAGGDLTLQTKFQAGNNYEFTAGGDLMLLVEEGLAAHVEATAGGGVVSHFGGTKSSMLPGFWSYEFGQGGPNVKLRAGGEIIIKTRDERDDARRAREEAQRAREIERERIREQARHMRDEGQRIRQEALRMKQELREQMRGQREEIRRSVKSGINLGGFAFGFGKGGKRPETPMPPTASVSAEERLKILKMLEDKVITAEQAEMLLSALGE